MGKRARCCFKYLKVNIPLRVKNNRLVYNRNTIFHLYYLYIFKNENSKYILIHKLDDVQEVTLSQSYTKLLFDRNTEYYVYFSHKKLQLSDINNICEKPDLFLYKIAMKKNKRDNIITISNSFIIWMTMLKKIDEYYSDKKDLVQAVIDIYQLSYNKIKIKYSKTGLYYAARSLKLNRFVLLPDGQLFDALHFFYELQCLYRGVTPYWELAADTIGNETVMLLQNIADKKTKKSYTFFSASKKVIGDYADPLGTAGCILAIYFISQYREQLQKNTPGVFAALLEEYLLSSNKKSLAICDYITGKIKTLFDFEKPEDEMTKNERVKGQYYRYVANIANRMPDVKTALDLYYSFEGQSESINIVRKRNVLRSVLEPNEDGTSITIKKYKNDGQPEGGEPAQFYIDPGAYDVTTQDGVGIYISSLFKHFVDAADASSMERRQRFKYVVDNMSVHCRGLRFKDEMHLSYAYSAVMYNLAEHFRYDKIQGGIRVGIRYDYDTPYDSITNEFRYIAVVDCITSTSIALNILGIAHPKHRNIFWYTPENRGDYSFDEEIWHTTGNKPEYKTVYYLDLGSKKYPKTNSCRIKTGEYANGVKNMLANNIYNRHHAPDLPYGDNPDQPATPMEVVRKDLKNDFTGVVGVKRAQMKLRDLRTNKTYFSNEYEGHFYTFTDKDGTEIAHSSGKKGLNNQKTPFSYRKTSFYFLRLYVPKEREE